MKIIRNFWGIIPIVIFLIIKVLLLLTEETMNLVFRYIPDCILFWFMLLAILVLLIYVIMKFFSWNAIRNRNFSQIIKYIVFSLYGIGVLATVLYGMVITSFKYYLEKLVVEKGVTMVVQDTSYLDFGEKYYEYENMLFRGKQVLKQIRNKTYWIYNSDGELLETGTYDN